MSALIPGELIPEPGEIELNAGRPVTVLVALSGRGDKDLFTVAKHLGMKI